MKVNTKSFYFSKQIVEHPHPHPPKTLLPNPSTNIFYYRRHPN